MKDFLRPEEINLLLKHCHEPFKTFVLTAILTGMRTAEKCIESGLTFGIDTVFKAAIETAVEKS